MVKKWLWPLLFAITLFAACGVSDEKTEIVIGNEESSTLSYSMVAVEKRDVASTVVVNVSYGANETEDYSFSVKNGKIEYVYVKRGDHVKKGEVLAILESDGLDTIIDNYEHSLAQKELELQQLLERKAFEIETEEYLFSYTKKTEDDREATDEAIEKIKKRYASSITTYEDSISILKLRLEEAKTAYKNSRIVSTVNGTVTFIKTNLEGSTVKPGDVIIKISDDKKCRLSSSDGSKADYFNEGEEYLWVVGAGTSAREYRVKPVNMSSWNGILFFEALEDADTISLNDSGKITITIAESKDVCSIPAAALHKSGEKYFVYYLDESGVRRMKWVVPGLQNQEYVEIKEGLAEGEYIILK